MHYGIKRRDFCKNTVAAAAVTSLVGTPWVSANDASVADRPFGEEYPNLDSLATGEWWTKEPKGPNPPPSMKVPRDQVIAFAIYTIDADVLSMSAQLYPLMPEETREVRLEVMRDGTWSELAHATVRYPGWDAHFRVRSWDASVSLP